MTIYDLQETLGVELDLSTDQLDDLGKDFDIQQEDAENQLDELKSQGTDLLENEEELDLAAQIKEAKDNFNKTIAPIKDKIKEYVDKIKSFIKDSLNKIQGWLDKGREWINCHVAKLKREIKNIKDKIKEMIDAVLKWIEKQFQRVKQLIAKKLSQINKKWSDKLKEKAKRIEEREKKRLKEKAKADVMMELPPLPFIMGSENQDYNVNN